MYKLCKTEQSASRQRQLEHGLLELMGSERYEDITVSDLCQHMQIPRKAFYRYFTSKDGALHALIDHTLMEFQSAAGADPKLSLEAELESFFCFWLERKNILKALVHSDLSGVLIERAIAYSMIDEVFPGRFLPGETKAVQMHVVSFSVCGLMYTMLRWHIGGYKVPACEMASVAVRLLTQPLFPHMDKKI